MGLLNKIRRHQAVAAGDFSKMFAKIEIPPLPEGASRLVAEINRPEPDVERLARVISGQPELSARVLQTVNSAYYSLPHRVKTVRHAIVLLGLGRIRSIALSHAAMASVPRPDGDLFDHGAFWTDSLVRALMVQVLAGGSGAEGAEEAFTALLLSDVALPVLLCAWGEYYAPVVHRWETAPGRLSGVEREQFRWDHAQAGAWILQSWGFPEDTVCFVGAHNLDREALAEVDLLETIALPISVASLLPSVLKPDPPRAAAFLHEIGASFPALGGRLSPLLLEVRGQVEELRGLFGLDDRGAATILEELAAAAEEDTP